MELEMVRRIANTVRERVRFERGLMDSNEEC